MTAGFASCRLNDRWRKPLNALGFARRWPHFIVSQAVGVSVVLEITEPLRIIKS
jgi:hypothetical protein